MVEYTIQKQKAAHVHKEKMEHGLKKTIPGTSLGSEGGFELRWAVEPFVFQHEDFGLAEVDSAIFRMVLSDKMRLKTML